MIYKSIHSKANENAMFRLCCIRKKQALNSLKVKRLKFISSTHLLLTYNIHFQRFNLFARNSIVYEFSQGVSEVSESLPVTNLLYPLLYLSNG